jgi:hypothetical protein
LRIDGGETAFNHSDVVGHYDTATSFFAIKNDMVKAGADSIDREIVVDGKLITSRALMNSRPF